MKNRDLAPLAAALGIISSICGITVAVLRFLGIQDVGDLPPPSAEAYEYPPILHLLLALSFFVWGAFFLKGPFDAWTKRGDDISTIDIILGLVVGAVVVGMGMTVLITTFLPMVFR